MGSLRDRAAALRGRARQLPVDVLRTLTPVAANQGTPRFLFQTSDTVIGPTVYRESGFQDEALRWVLERVGDRLEGRTLVDVGANIGTVAIPMVQSYGASRALALEADTLNHQLLRCNVILNDLESRITTAHVAVTDHEGFATFEISVDNLGDHRLRGDGPVVPGAHREHTRRTVQVPCARLDTVLAGHAVDPADVSLVWADIQGYEGHLFAGATLTLAAKVPFVVEYWPYGLTRSGGLAMFRDTVRAGFSQVLDIGRSLQLGRTQALDTTRIAEVGAWLGDVPDAHTDLLLLP